MAFKSIHKGKYYITFKRGYEDFKKNITLTIDKIFENDTLRISLSDEDDPTFLCILNVTRNDYNDLKKQQGLLVEFDNFPSQLIRLLQQCASNNMFLIIQQTNPLQYLLEVVEHNEFKRLVHLSLKTGPATDHDIKHHMADTIIHLKKTLTNLKSTLSSSEVLWNDKCINLERKVLDLTHVVSKMEEEKGRRDIEFQDTLKQERDRLTQERMQWQKSAELNAKEQYANSQENMNRKDKQIDELSAMCKQLQENIIHLEKQSSDKTNRVIVLEKEVQKTHIEVATLKAKHTTLEMELSEKEKQYNQLSLKFSYLEKVTKDDKEAIRDLNTSIQILKKEKSSLEDRLALSENLASKNNEAAHCTSEQLMKANQIISKLNADLIEIKEKLLCRTAIALEQEKVVEANAKEIEELNAHILLANKNYDELKSQFDTLQEKYTSNEKTLIDRDETIKNNNMVIQWLHKKLENTCIQTDGLINSPSVVRQASSSTPYFLPRNNQSTSQENSDGSINFYATSKSTIEDSPNIEEIKKSNKVGLDLKYLQPAVEDRINSRKEINSKSSYDQKGKENKDINLPQVNYREKKSSRSNTYRTTPVSAYFPR